MDLMVDIILELLSTFLDVIIILWLCGGGGNPSSQEILAEVFRYLQFSTGSSKNIYIDSKTLTTDVL